MLARTARESGLPLIFYGGYWEKLRPKLPEIHLRTGWRQYGAARRVEVGPPLLNRKKTGIVPFRRGVNSALTV